jgi:hypothetical protein
MRVITRCLAEQSGFSYLTDCGEARQSKGAGRVAAAVQGADGAVEVRWDRDRLIGCFIYKRVADSQVCSAILGEVPNDERRLCIAWEDILSQS